MHKPVESFAVGAIDFVGGSLGKLFKFLNYNKMQLLLFLFLF